MHETLIIGFNIIGEFNCEAPVNYAYYSQSVRKVISSLEASNTSVEDPSKNTVKTDRNYYGTIS
jgi:hypothetical protein